MGNLSPKGEGRPTVSLVLELWTFGPADSLNAYGGMSQGVSQSVQRGISDVLQARA
jgi:hypothetical protein